MNEQLSVKTKELSAEEKESIHSKNLESYLYKMIQEAPVISNLNESEAPFKEFDKNTKEVWQHVSSTEINNYLEKKLFFNKRNINEEDKVPQFEIYKKIDEEPIQIPIDLIVHAEGFKDWKGRMKGHNKDWRSEYGDGTSDSFTVIRHYAGIPSQLPPVSRMNMYIQPDKKVFFDNSNGDSHRIAAAVLRGQKTIGTESLKVYQLKKNYL